MRCGGWRHGSTVELIYSMHKALDSMLDTLFPCERQLGVKHGVFPAMLFSLEFTTVLCFHSTYFMLLSSLVRETALPTLCNFLSK